MDQGWNFCLYKAAPLWLWECTFPFHWKLKTASSQLELKYQTYLSEAEQTSAGQGRAGRSRADWSRAI